ncbi:MAG: hypothetical protein LBV22_03595 [Mycoplasmataceae bacterium]|nr:hypothetical protein [Mycoplasmataceae bacterium]
MEEGAEYRKLYDEGIIDKVLDKVEPTEAIRRDLWLVICKGGHVGRDRYYELHLAIKASNAKEASEIAIRKPRVKHDHTDVILKKPINISYEEFKRITDDNWKDPYFHIKSTYQDTGRYLHMERLKPEKNYVSNRVKKIKNNYGKKWD